MEKTQTPRNEGPKTNDHKESTAAVVCQRKATSAGEDRDNSIRSGKELQQGTEIRELH